MRVLAEYKDCVSFNSSKNVYNITKRNMEFYHGNQWNGLRKMKKLRLMTQNFLQRPVSYFVSQIVSDDIGFSVEPLIPGAYAGEAMDALPDMVERVFVRNDWRATNREIIKNGAIEGEGCLYWWFDTDAETGDQARGDIRCELIPTCNVLYGNPYSNDTQGQPYIMVVRRIPINVMQERAKALGYAHPEQLTGDTDDGRSRQDDDRRITEILKLWKVSKDEEVKDLSGKKQTVKRSSVHFCRMAGQKIIQKDTDTGCSLYPVTRFCWNQVPDNYHGSNPVSAFIPAQIVVNQALTLVCEFVKNNSLPKVFANKAAFPRGLSNDPTAVNYTQTDPNLAVYQIAPGAEVPTSIVSMMQSIVDQTRDFMGTSDAALGNIRPDNTSAIIATQKATAAPLLLQTQSFYQYVRECVRIVIDMMGAYYGERVIRYDTDDAIGGSVPVYVDFSSLFIDEIDLEINVGAASYWSELTTVQTLDNLVGNGILPISDPNAMLIYLNNLPTGYLPGKEEVLKYYQDIVEQQQLQQQGQVLADQIAAEAQMNQAAPEEQPQTLGGV